MGQVASICGLRLEQGEIVELGVFMRAGSRASWSGPTGAGAGRGSWSRLRAEQGGRAWARSFGNGLQMLGWAGLVSFKNTSFFFLVFLFLFFPFFQNTTFYKIKLNQIRTKYFQ